jgi:hypothetical protein
MKTLIAVFLLCWFSHGSFAQYGNYFLSHYSPNAERFDNVCFDIAQGTNGVMHFATRSGVLKFDGLNWDILHGQSAIYSLQIDGDGNIYWAGAKGFGRIIVDEKGFEQIQFLSDSTAKNVFQALAVKDDIYFLSDEFIYIFNTKTQKTAIIRSTNITGAHSKLFELFGAVYVSTKVGGVFRVDQNKLIRSKLGIQGDVIFFSRMNNTYVLGTADNNLYTCSESLQIRSIPIQDHAYVNASVIVSGSLINSQLLALGTLRGGVMFINPITGRTKEIINYSTGLPDNEVFALTPDRNHNIWVAHDYGFTRIAPHMPFRSYSHYTGLQGNLLCAYSSRNSGGNLPLVYVGTSLGLFKLEKESIYQELTSLVDVEIKGKKIKSEKEQENDQGSSRVDVESKKGWLFNFLRGNKKQEKAATTKVEKTNTTPVDQKIEKRQSIKEKRVERILMSSSYKFKKVQSINAKITHLVAANSALIASGLGGIYEINGLESRPILEEPVRFLYASQYRDMLFASTYNDEVRSFIRNNKGWQQTNLLSQLDDQINYIFEGNEKELWLCGLNRIYRLEITPVEIRLIQTIEISNANFDKVVGVRWKDNIMFANAEGFFQFDRKSSTLLKLDTLPKPTQYFAHDGNIVYRDHHGWSVLGSQKQLSNLQLFNLFPDMRFITSEQHSDNYWMISGSNELYRFEDLKQTPYESTFPLFLKSVFNHEKKIGANKSISISEQQSAVTFHVSQPDYISPQSVEFRYSMRGGMNEEWSEWSTNNNVINFPYLPPNRYTLHVQAKNIFGKITDMEPATFEVLPPYWERPWFYALEFAVFALLVVLSFRLNARYRIISRILSLLTIILLIQFIQTVIEATVMIKDNPVINFFIQVLVALLILPVEGYLRNVMLRSLAQPGKFYKYMKPKSFSVILKKGSQDLKNLDED